MVWRCSFVGKTWENLCGKYKLLITVLHNPQYALLKSPFVPSLRWNMTNMPKASESTKCVVQTCSDFFLKVPLTQCYVSRPHSSHDSTFLHSTADSRNLQANREASSLDSNVPKFYKWRGFVNSAVGISFGFSCCSSCSLRDPSSSREYSAFFRGRKWQRRKLVQRNSTDKIHQIRFIFRLSVFRFASFFHGKNSLQICVHFVAWTNSLFAGHEDPKACPHDHNASSIANQFPPRCTVHLP